MNNNELKAKDYIIEAIFQLMNKKNYNDITITDITKKAGVNRVTFYRNFNSKEDVVKEHLKVCDDKFNKVKSSNDNGLYQMLNFFEINRKTINLLYKSNCSHLLTKHFLDNWNYDKSDNNIIAYTKSAWAYFMIGWANEWYLRGMQETPEQMVAIFENMQKNTNS